MVSGRGYRWLSAGVMCFLASSAFAVDCPEFVGSFETPDRAYDVAVHNRIAYVADGHAGLRIFDLWPVPVEAGALAMEGEAVGVALAGDHTFVVSTLGFHVVDVSTPSDPVEVGSAEGGFSNVVDVVVDGSHVYVADDSGMHIFDVDNPSEPSKVGLFESLGGARKGLDVTAGYAYLVNGNLTIIDVRDPSSPVEVGTFNPNHGMCAARDVVASGGYAYVSILSDTPVEFVVVDVSDPSNPVEVGCCDTTWSVLRRDMAVFGNFVYEMFGSQGYFGLRVVDVSDPTDPGEMGMAQFPGTSRGVTVSGGHVYAAADDAGVFFFRKCPSVVPGHDGVLGEGNRTPVER